MEHFQIVDDVGMIGTSRGNVEKNNIQNIQKCQKLLGGGKLKGPLSIHMATYRLLFLILKRLNTWFVELYPLLSQEIGMIKLIRRTRDFVFTSTKSELLNKLLDLTADESIPTLSVKINRMKAAALLSSYRTSSNAAADGVIGDISSNGANDDIINPSSSSFRQYSIFASAFRQLQNASVSRFRVSKPSGAEPHLAFRICTENEQVVGEGGPYRQFFTDISRELQLPESPLFMPSPNNRNSMGDHRDKFILKQASQCSECLDMLRFLGVLFGICIRTGVKMMLYCPPLMWKMLSGERVTRHDLKDIDYGTAEVLALFEQLDEKSFMQTFSSSETQDFTIRLSDGSTKELKKGGSSILVTWQNRLEYVDLAFRARIYEHRVEIEALRTGLESVVPAQALNLMTWADFERSICGRQEIDVVMLRRHTKYSGVSSTAPHIKMFWHILESSSQETLRNLISFCWGQTRLPATDKEFEITHTRFLIKASSYRNPDRVLPRADTCFFNLELPAYSSEEIMREKLLYAINTATTMNADQNQED